MAYPDLLIILVVLAGISASLGAWLTGLPDVSRKLVPLGGAILVGISAFWIMPELVESFGWPAGLALLLGSVLLIWIVDRFVYPVCPSCSHSHDHDTCSTRLHGFAPPLIVASVVHSLFDGWMLAYGQSSAHSSISLGVAIHKLPECLAFGVILRAALKSRTQAIAWSFVSQLPMLLGASMPGVSPMFAGAMLAMGGGTFSYLGFHAVHAEWKRRARLKLQF